MRHVSTLTTLLLLSAYGCGSHNSGPAAAAPQATPAATVGSTDPASLALAPQLAIVRVPVDATGTATGAPELRAADASATATDADSAAAAFTAATPAAKMVASSSELDGDSSTQSWSQWSNYGGGRGYGGSSYGGGYGGISYGNSGWGSSYWQNSYSPSLYWQNHNWGYGYNSCYNGGGYAYYCYSPRTYW